MTAWVILFVAAVGIVLYTAIRISKVRVAKQVRCPVHGDLCEVDFICETGSAWEPGRALDVVRCTRFKEPDQVTCQKRCRDFPIVDDAVGRAA